MRRGVAVVGLVSGAFGLVQPGAIAQPHIASEPGGVSVSALRGVVAFSRYDPDVRQYRLAVVRANNVVEQLPIRARRVPFDVDLGSDSKGRLVAAYSRCAREPDAVRGFVGSYSSGRGCDVYAYSFARRVETRVRTVSTVEHSEVLPSIDGSRIAFVRRAHGASRAEVFVGSRLRATTATQLPGGSRSASGPYGNEDPGPLFVDLGRKGVLYRWRSAPAACPGEEASQAPATQDEVWVKPLTGQQRLVARVCSSTGGIPAAAATGSAIFYVRSGAGAGGDRSDVLIRSDWLSGHADRSTPTVPEILSLAIDRRTLVLARGARVGGRLGVIIDRRPLPAVLGSS